MARKLRLEFPGAIYHVINRGNYRAHVFKSEGARQAFANRFNKLRGERGHLFQGRYKSLLAEEGAALGLLCDYLHLNPVRAHLMLVDRLDEYRHSSYWYLSRPKLRPKFLHSATALAEAGELADTPAGWGAYADYLAWQAEEGPVGKSKAYVSMSKGWALGGKGFKQTLLQDQAVATVTRAWESDGVREVREAQWQEVLDRLRQQIPAEQTRDRRKSAPWKVQLALRMKATTDASNGWLAAQLGMGSGVYLSKHIGLARRKVKGKA